MSAVILRFLKSGEPCIATLEDVTRRVAWCSVTKLRVPIEEMRFCAKCQSEQRFVADRDCAYGLVGVCMGCGDEWLRPFKRTTAVMAS